MAGDAMPERENLFEEGVLGAPEPDHVGAGLAPAQHGAQANEQDLQKLVALGIACARILEIRKNRRKLLHGTTFDPEWCQRLEPVRLPSQVNSSCAITLFHPPSGRFRPARALPLLNWPGQRPH